MADAGFFRGTSSDQDGRFSDKEKKLLKQMKFEDTLDRKINMDKINLDVIKPWITLRINEILGIEDDVVIEYIMSQLEEKTINPKIMQINITGFLNARRAREFMGELWMLLIEADESEDGIPRSLVEKKMNEMRKEPRSTGNGDARYEPTPQSCDWANRYSSLSGGRYTGPTKEKEVTDDRITRISPRGGTPPRQKRSSLSRERSRERERIRNEREGTPPRRKAFDDREKERGKDRDREREQRRQQRIDEEKKREEESKRREEERLKRRAEEKEREKRKEEERLKERERRRAAEERERERRRKRSRSRSRSPGKRRFTEGTSSSKRKRSPSSSDSEDLSRKKRKKKHSRRSSDEDSDYDRKIRKDKKAKKHKKEKKKKERKRTPTPSSSSSSLSDTE